MSKVPKWPNYIDRHSTLLYIVPMDESTNPNKISSDLLRGHTDTIILKLLIGGDKYGYEISKLIHVNSSGEYELKEATMYSSLKRLEGDGCITSYWGDETQGGRRRYYQITARGKKVYSENKVNWEYAKRVLDNLL